MAHASNLIDALKKQKFKKTKTKMKKIWKISDLLFFLLYRDFFPYYYIVTFFVSLSILPYEPSN